MSQVSRVALEDLGRRLSAALGPDSLLARRFDKALRRQDEVAIAAALDTLRLYPEAVRARVEATLTEWLLHRPDAPPAGALASS